MAEKTSQETNSEQMKERFHFVLTVNGNIVCKRFFRINGFKNEAECSQQLVAHYFDANGDGTFNYVEGTLERCVRMIQKDLAHKSNVYLWNTAPQIFETEKEMNEVTARPDFKLDVASYIVIRENGNVYVWNGESAEAYNIDGKPVAPYTNVFNASDYIGGVDSETKNVLKLAFYDNGREVCAQEWDANVYPRFVRNNIDISNTKNKYKQEGQFQIVEATLVDLMTAGQPDLIPLIIREFCQCCSLEDRRDYNTSLEFGKSKYNLNYEQENGRNIRNVERQVRKKTDKHVKAMEKFYSDKAYATI